MSNGGSFYKNKKTYGRTKKKTLAKAWERLGLNTKYVTCRWQSIGDNNFAAGLGSQILEHRSTAIDSIQLPMFAFNLTTIGSGYMNQPTGTPTQILMKTYPMYRLNKTGVPGVTGQQYKWSPVIGTNNNANGTTEAKPWQVEDRNSVPGFTKLVTHAWTDVKAVIYGAKQRQHTVHMDVVQFLEDDMGPARMYENDAPTELTFDASTVSPVDPVHGDIDAYWDSFWCNKIGNPIRTNKSAPIQPMIKWLKKDACKIVADNSTDQDSSPDKVIKEFFMREDKTYQVKDVLNPEYRRTEVIVGGDQVPSYDDSTIVEETGIFPARQMDKWLLIWCGDCFDYIPLGTAVNNFYNPSFDVNIRGKWYVTN